MSNIRPPRRVENPELRRVVDDIYKELIDIKKSVNKSYSGHPPSSSGKKGDIAVYKDQGGNHILACKTSEGWARVGLSLELKHGEKFEGVGISRNSVKLDKVDLTGDDSLNLTSSTTLKPQVTLKNLSTTTFSPPYISFNRTNITQGTATTDNFLGAITSYNDNTANENTLFTAIFFKTTDKTDGAEDGQIAIATKLGGSDKYININGGVIELPSSARIDNVTSSSYLIFENEENYRFSGGNTNGAALNLELFADGVSPDDEDKALISLADGGVLTYQSFIGGSTWKTLLTVTPHATPASSTVAIAGNLTVGGTVGNLTFTNGAIIDNTTSANVLSFHTENAYKFSTVTGQPLIIGLHSDLGEDDIDQWTLNIADGGVMTFQNKASGSDVAMLTATPHATATSSTITTAGDLTVSGGDVSINGTEGGAANLFLKSDESDDSGDDWKIYANASTPSILGFENNASGSFQSMFYITPNATPVDSNAVFSGQVTLQNKLFLKMEIATPTAPGDGSGAYLYPKTDGDPYWISHDQGEVNLNLIKTATITVSEAEFDALDTTAKTIVAAPGGHKVIILTDAIVFATHGSTQTDRENLTIGWNGGTTYETDVAAWIPRFMSGESGNRTFRFTMVDANGDAFWQSINMGDNQPLTLGLTGSLPDGCISSLKVLVNYYIFDNS